MNKVVETSISVLLSSYMEDKITARVSGLNNHSIDSFSILDPEVKEVEDGIQFIGTGVFGSKSHKFYVCLTSSSKPKPVERLSSHLIRCKLQIAEKSVFDLLTKEGLFTGS